MVELYPPAVQSKCCRVSCEGFSLRNEAELHDEKHQPDIKNGQLIGMPLGEFIEKAYKGLAAGQEQVLVGNAEEAYELFEGRRQDYFIQNFAGR